MSYIGDYTGEKTRKSINLRTKQFSETVGGSYLHEELLKMAKSKHYNTRSMYTTLDTDNNQQTFVEKHMKYASQFPNLNYAQYVSNLKLMTKIS